MVNKPEPLFLTLNFLSQLNTDRGIYSFALLFIHSFQPTSQHTATRETATVKKRVSGVRGGVETPALPLVGLGNSGKAVSPHGDFIFLPAKWES